MIKLKTVDEPAFLSTAAIGNIINQARIDVAAGNKPNLPDLWSKDDDSREAQHERHHNGKCCYCERKRDIKLERDVEHYRPKKNVKDVAGSNGYWWLAYDWENILIACKTCNSIYKGTKFPLLDNTTRVNTEGDVSTELTALINPAIENPEPYISYFHEKIGGAWMACIVPSPTDNGKGETTIKTLGLDRPELMGSEERAESIPRLLGLIENHSNYSFVLDRAITSSDAMNIAHCEEKIKEIEGDLRKEISPYKTYAGFRRCMIRRHATLEHLLDE